MLTKNQIKVLKGFKNYKNPVLYFLEYIQVKNKQAVVTDLKHTLILKGIDLPDGMYDINNFKKGNFIKLEDLITDFPIFEIPTLTGEVINPNTLIKLNRAVNFISKDPLRPALNLVHAGAGICGTNAHFMYFDNSSLQNTYLIDPQTIKCMIDYCYITQLDKYIYIDHADYSFICDLQEVKYPDYFNVIPKDNPLKYSFSKKDILKHAPALLLNTNKITSKIIFNFTAEGLTLFAEDLDYKRDYKCTIPCTFLNSFQIVFNFKLFEKIINTIDCDLITIEGSTANRGVIINQHFLIMPLFLNQ